MGIVTDDTRERFQFTEQILVPLATTLYCEKGTRASSASEGEKTTDHTEQSNHRYDRRIDVRKHPRAG